ncbi:high affinity cationic amino acid transporter 1-like isoform X2 [Convolutriloba macropyga]|uniref:high affinity cationic amino acid transporter 1-like isoform X2 n=1 Tax=Convolutriloba macropyga TaxID=536237 RepID=UPI003F522737
MSPKKNYQSMASIRKMSMKMVRRPEIEADVEIGSQLNRTLGTFHLTMLGVGSTLGAGIYVIAGMVAHRDAGPATILSFLFAALASLLAGFFYAEFGSRVPKSGSAYTYIYTSIGELSGFVLGWTMIMQYVIGSASTAKAMSQYFDKAILGGSLETFLRETMPINNRLLAPYPDLLSFTVILILTVLLWWGVKESTLVTNVLTILNICVITFIASFGLYAIGVIGFENWTLSPSEVTKGEGGFMPFGFSGVVAGASICFYAFIGFDVIATAGEEVKNPTRAIPIATILCIAICTVAYAGVSIACTITLPYDTLDPEVPIPQIFREWGLPYLEKVVSGGAICALTTSLFGSLFPMPRIIYSMANDGILFKSFASVSLTRKTPTYATWISGSLAAVLAVIVNLEDLVDMMSIGTLLSYTMVAMSVLILRYRRDAPCPAYAVSNHVRVDKMQDKTRWDIMRMAATSCKSTGTEPSKESETLAVILTFLLTLGAFIGAAICVSTHFLDQSKISSSTYIASIVFLSLTSIAEIVMLWLLARLPQKRLNLRFKVWGIPALPVFTAWLNLVFMLELPLKIWIYFLIWLFLGFLIYFSYGMHNSRLEKVALSEDDESERDSIQVNNTAVDTSTENKMQLLNGQLSFHANSNCSES